MTTNYYPPGYYSLTRFLCQQKIFLANWLLLIIINDTVGILWFYHCPNRHLRRSLISISMSNEMMTVQVALLRLTPDIPEETVYMRLHCLPTSASIKRVSAVS